MGANCAGTSQPGLIPVIDLAGGTYTDPQGGVHPGGLYDTGSNSRPPEIGAVMPTVTAVGKVLGAALLGGSNIRNIGVELLPTIASDPVKASKVKFANGGIGGVRLDDWANPNAPGWASLASQLSAAGISSSQLRVVFFMNYANAETGIFETEVAQNAVLMDAVVANIHSKYPSVRSVYLCAMHYFGYGALPWANEPMAYWNSWSIQRVIAGRAGTAAPWTVAGPYPWTNGETPRMDGRFYVCTDFQQDGPGNGVGTHMLPSGAAKAKEDFLNFLHTDPSASWYRA